MLGQKGVWEMNPTGSWWDLLFRLLQAARPAGPYVRHLRVIYDGKADAELPHSAVLEILRWVPHSTWVVYLKSEKGLLQNRLRISSETYSETPGL